MKPSVLSSPLVVDVLSPDDELISRDLSRDCGNLCEGVVSPST